ncbi:hypothetical protein RFI_32695 [Reticulomyxa filosa]|uniref:Uncharacterized protein n=1 Tax=Reticulomyxa filosa TaxID=46433 RepID=X6LTI9_RETFI|nr:hypothetical protein RFI_32695 [Reticulomyxa filosa]|eukprot:ETO04701.1 hypothetical protein RFI_32695 [Reticulomyxa filosa]
MSVFFQSTVICSGSADNTIRFWDIRNNKQLHVIKGNENEDGGIYSLTFLPLKNKENVCKKTDDNVNLYLGKVKFLLIFFILFNFDPITTKYVKHLVKSILFFIDNLYLHNSVVVFCLFHFEDTVLFLSCTFLFCVEENVFGTSDKTAIIIENFSSLIYARRNNCFCDYLFLLFL